MCVSKLSKAFKELFLDGSNLSSIIIGKRYHVPGVKSSIDNAIVGRIDTIPTNELIDVNDSHPVDTVIHLDLPNEVMDTLCKDDKTYVIIAKETDILKFEVQSCFMRWLEERTMLLPIIDNKEYSSVSIREKWMDIVSHNAGQFVFNISYVPNIEIWKHYFYDSRKNDLRIYYQDQTINLIVISVPSKKNGNFYTNENDSSVNVDTMYLRTVIENVIDGVIKCGPQKIVVDPFACKFMRKNPILTATVWRDLLADDRASKNIKSVDFVSSFQRELRIFTSELTKVD